MTAALTPELALSYVRELSADVRDGVVLDAAGAVLAGTAALAGSASDDVIQEHSAMHTIAVQCGPFALHEVVRIDLRTALSRLDSTM